MVNKRSDILPVVLTVLLLLLIAILFFFVEMIALNGVSEGKASSAMGISLLGMAVVLVSVGAFAGWASKVLVAKFHWNRALSISVVVLAATFLGTFLFFITIIVSILFAGIK